MSDFSAYLPAAREIALRAGGRLRELLNTTLVHSRKEDKSLVTNADHDANDIIRNGLREAFPSHRIISEESGAEGPASRFVWLVDPLDGTKAFARGEAGFSVMLGLLRDEQPVLGVVYDPYEDRLYEAAQGEGCFVTERGARRAARVSARKDWQAMPVISSTGVPEPIRRSLESALGVKFLSPINSVGIKVGFLVRQEADVYVNHHPVHYWDTCAPVAILQEAGGVFTFWDGLPMRYDLTTDLRHHGPTAASNGSRHKDLLDALAKIPK